MAQNIPNMRYKRAWRIIAFNKDKLRNKLRRSRQVKAQRYVWNFANVRETHTPNQLEAKYQMENSRDQLSTLLKSKLFMADKGKGDDEQSGNWWG